MQEGIHYSSFRDPSGFVFVQDGVLCRAIRPSYKEHFDLLMSSGLYAALVERELLVPHQERQNSDSSLYKVIVPRRLPFISYPYEWSFSMLKDAALATLEVQKLALEHGMSLKDASAYNMQFENGKPVLIDTLSFERYEAGKPWVAYRQFCQHFLAPLALMAKKDVRLSQILRIYVDGVPLDLASSLLPWTTYVRPGLFSHIHLHSKSQKAFANKRVSGKKYTLSTFALKSLLESLRSTVAGLSWQGGATEWADYYESTNYSALSFTKKAEIVDSFLEKAKPREVWDLGSNNGYFSRIATKRGIRALAFDIDPSAVEENYRTVRAQNETLLLPLLLDLTNPSPALGWHERERESFAARGPADMVFALALIHHLSISNNMPFESVAAFFKDIGRKLVIEFVPKSDSQVQKLLSSREDIFTEYDQSRFEAAFSRLFAIDETRPVSGTERTLYLMSRK